VSRRALLFPEVPDAEVRGHIKTLLHRAFQRENLPVPLGALVPLAFKRLDAAALEQIRTWDPEIDLGFTSTDLPDNTPILVHWRAFDRSDRVRALVAAEVAGTFLPELADLVARFVVG
jgi:hypothetical protein